MQTKPLVYGLIGFILSGLLVSIAATTFNKPDDMADMTRSLETKTGRAYDQAFAEMMIKHHQSAIDMARLSQQRADSQQVKEMSKAILTTQQAEITQMQHWLQAWGKGQLPEQHGH